MVTNLKVLIVDDMNTMRKLVMRACKEMGFADFTEAADGVIAWQAISGSPKPFDLVISDWNMPNCTGLDLLKRVRTDGRFKSTPFVLLTAETEVSQVQDAIAAGVNGYVLKPFTTDSLRTKVFDILKIKAA
jgi:two-component system chemotaxis response regulator CheY